MIKVEVYKDRKNEFRWRAIAKNGRILATGSEAYKRRADLVKAVNILRLDQWEIKDLLYR